MPMRAEDRVRAGRAGGETTRRRCGRGKGRRGPRGRSSLALAALALAGLAPWLAARAWGDAESAGDARAAGDARMPVVTRAAGEGAHAGHGTDAEAGSSAAVRPSSEEGAGAATEPTRVARFEAPEPGSYELPPIDRIEPHTLLGSSGDSEPLLSIGPGELALVSFVYLQCNEACPLSTALLHQLDRELARDPQLAGRVELVTVSFDPTRDTPEALAALRARLAPRGRWRFLTARDEGALRPVLADFGQDAVWIPGERNAPDALRHVLKVFLVDGDRAVRQIYSTGFLDRRLVLADLRTLSQALPPSSESTAGP